MWSYTFISLSKYQAVKFHLLSSHVLLWNNYRILKTEIWKGSKNHKNSTYFITSNFTSNVLFLDFTVKWLCIIINLMQRQIKCEIPRLDWVICIGEDVSLTNSSNMNSSSLHYCINYSYHYIWNHFSFGQDPFWHVIWIL